MGLWDDALYMTLLVLSTVGFREVRPLDASGRVFTATLMIAGVALVLVTITVVATWVTEEQMWASRRRKRMQKRLDAMSDHFIICAYGRVGRAVARDFEAEGVPFVVIDPKEELEERMLEDGVAYLMEDPSLEHVLERAGISRARGLVCANAALHALALSALVVHDRRAALVKVDVGGPALGTARRGVEAEAPAAPVLADESFGLALG